ncbi:MAG: glycosyltransferase family 39 protein [Kiritimatiellales bacterium]|nr:glycosyltransferase family 39 protein [Kiritimatiellota bacterium]MBL7012665.1 glycosyltransferase family 39 protein [Kiritimatiellales bacterium]
MRQMFSDLKWPLLLIAVLGLYAMLSVPILPIDETRYVSVAWDMWNRHSFLVPHLNGVPYSQKPPMLFWLIQAGWKLFGVNDFTPRLIPCFFSMLNLMLVYRISLRLWPEERKAAVYSALILASTLIWSVWSFSIMFDMILAFWILLGLLGTLRCAAQRRDGWFLLIAGVAGGLLTKGPAILVCLLSVPLFRAWWDTRREKPVGAAWYWSVLGAGLAGFALALCWAVPAAILGGEVYGNDILWGQTVGRVTSSAAHHRPVWWYLPILPLFFFPWILFRSVFEKPDFKTTDCGVRFCLTWLGLPLLIFSMISGKQIHYLIPFIPAGALLMGRNLSRNDGRVDSRIPGVLFLLLSLASVIFPPFSQPGGDLGPLDPGDTRFIFAGLLICGLLFLYPLQKNSHTVRRVALTMILFLFCALFHNKQSFLDNYDIKAVSVRIGQKMAEGCPVANVGQYHGQYQFLGRLTNPLIELDGQTDFEQFDAEHPGTLFISYQKEGEDKLPAGATVCFAQEFRGKNVLLWQFSHSAP